MTLTDRTPLGADGNAAPNTDGGELLMFTDTTYPGLDKTGAQRFAALTFPALVNPNRESPDWPAFYAAARLSTGDIYSSASSHRITSQFASPKWTWAFVRPPFYASLLTPLGRMSPRGAFVTWQILNLLALVGAGLILGLLPTALISLLFPPVALSLVQGQDMPLMLFAVSVSVALQRRNKPFAAGLLLALLGIKFHLFLLIPVFLIARRAWVAAAGLCTGGVALLAFSFWRYSLDWPLRYYRCVMENEKVLTQVARHGDWQPVMWLIGAAVCWIICRRITSFEGTFVCTLVMGAMIGHHFAYDYVICVPAFVWAVQYVVEFARQPRTVNSSVPSLVAEFA